MILRGTALNARKAFEQCISGQWNCLLFSLWVWATPQVNNICHIAIDILYVLRLNIVLYVSLVLLDSWEEC